LIVLDYYLSKLAQKNITILRNINKAEALLPIALWSGSIFLASLLMFGV